MDVVTKQAGTTSVVGETILTKCTRRDNGAFCMAMILKLLIIALATVGNKSHTGRLSSCVVLPSVPNQTDPSLHTAAASFTNVGSNIFGISDVKQCEVRTSPNCLFPQWDPKLHKWDDGSFVWKKL